MFSKTLLKKCLSLLITLSFLFVLLPPEVFYADDAPPELDNYVLNNSWGGEANVFNEPVDVAIGPDGRIYVLNRGLSRVTVITPGEEVYKNFGSYGGTQGQLVNLTGIATDDDGNVYVLGSWNVNKFTADGDYVKSWGSFSDAEGIAYHDGFIYIVEYSYNFDNDSYAHCFYKFNLEGDLALDEPWCGVEGSGDGEFNRPSDIAVDQTGNIFIADTQNHRIQKLSPTGEYLGQWGSVGSGEGEFNTPLHISIANSGNIYVSDWGNYRVQVFSESFNFIEEFYLFGAEEEPHFRSPRGMDFDAKGNLFVAVSGIGRVQKYSPTHDFITQLGIPPYAQGQFNIPMDIAIDSVGNVYVADTYNRRIQKFNPYGVFLTEWPIPFEGINWSYPISIAIDLDDFVYVLDQSYAQVQKYDSTGNRVVGWALEAGIIAIDVDYPLGIAVDTGGYLYVAGGYSKKIHKFTTEDGTFVTEWGGEGEIGYPVDVAVDAVGDVYLIDQNDFLVRKYDSSGTLKTAWGGDGVFPGPTSLAVDVEGYVYVLDSVAKNIHVFTAGGEFVSLWSTYILEAEEQLNSPRGITLDGNGKIFITDTFNQRIQVLAPDLPEEDPESGLILNGNFVSETREDGLSAQRVVSVNNLDFTRGAGLRTNDGLDYWAYGGTLAVDRTTETYQGVYSLRLGEPVAPVGQGLGTAWASQVFYIPPGSAAELSFNINVFTNDNINRADFIVEIQDAVALNNLAVVTQEGYQTGVEGERPDGTVELGWKTVRYDLSPFSGRVVRLVLSNRNLTQDSLGIWSYVEKVAVSTESPVGTSPNKLYLPMVLH